LLFLSFCPAGANELIAVSLKQGADFIIAAAIVYHLSKAKATSTFADTNSLLSRVIWGTLETNAGKRSPPPPLEGRELTLGARLVFSDRHRCLVRCCPLFGFDDLQLPHYHQPGARQTLVRALLSFFKQALERQGAPSKADSYSLVVAA
jgi:hypothetical protein